MPTPTPCGAWPSPISADRAARGAPVPGFVRVGGDGTLWWTESRPTEDGRNAIRRAAPGTAPVDVGPAGWNARSAVHEYGGRSFLPVGDAVVAAAWEDQRLWRLGEAADEPAALTPTPPVPRGWRYAEPVRSPSGDAVWCVRERHDVGVVRHDLVAVPLDGSAAADPSAVRTLAAGSDFVAAPRPSPDGRRLAWIAWNHPQMPWDGAELRVADVAADGTVGPGRTVLGGPTESVLFPQWAGQDALYVVSDRTGWWNLYRADLDGDIAPLAPAEEEFGVPMWLLGFATYALLGDGRLAVVHGHGTDRLGVLDPATGALDDLDLPWTVWRPTLHAEGSVLGAVAASPTAAPTVLRIDMTTGSAEPVGGDEDEPLDPAYLPEPRLATFAGTGGREVHAVVYPPRHPDVTPPPDERPPYVVFVHGGPTAHVHAELDPTKVFFTSRGIGVVDVDYGGSSGYGRAYRERLHRQWGIVDVEDCIAAALGLADEGDADRARLAIRGGSAGGWTTLSALTQTAVFATGTSYYGVAELLRFAEDTHDFESRYLDGLIGELPADRAVYIERAPLSHVDDVSCPVLLLQGLEDEVVPPSQSEMFRDALARKGIPHAYLAFPGEQHGFRKAETVATCLEAELSFYGQVLGFDPPGIPPLELSSGTADPSEDRD